MLDSFQDSVVKRTWSQTAEVIVLFNLSIISKSFSLKDPEYVLIQLLMRVVREIHMTFKSLELFSSSFYNLQKLGPVVLYRID
jgi:hypothetical protein